MKKLFYCVIAVFAIIPLISCSLIDDNIDFSVSEMSVSEILFLDSPTCAYSRAARQYIDETYPDIAIRHIDIDDVRNEKYVRSASCDYNLGNFIDTPIICLGADCICGWNAEKKQKFDLLVIPYIRK